jgi:hypothetical protein
MEPKFKFTKTLSSWQGTLRLEVSVMDGNIDKALIIFHSTGGGITKWPLWLVETALAFENAVSKNGDNSAGGSLWSRSLPEQQVMNIHDGGIDGLIRIDGRNALLWGEALHQIKQFCDEARKVYKNSIIQRLQDTFSKTRKEAAVMLQEAEVSPEAMKQLLDKLA